MKKHLIFAATLAASATLLSSCFEKEQKPEPVVPTQPEKPTPPAKPTDEEVCRLILEQLPPCDKATSGALTYEEPTKNDDGSLSITAHLTMVIKENLYVSEASPEAFKKERQAVNDSANKAMQPESLYLLQIGASTDVITDDDRKAKALPADLQAALNELKELTDGTVLRQTFKAGDEVNVTISFHATYKEDAWSYDNIILDNAALQALDDLVKESNIKPETDFVLTPEFEEQRKQLIREKVQAFNNAAQPYILSREENARTTLTQLNAKAAEEAKRTQEETEAAENEKRQRIEACVAALASGKDFSGEWTRADRFGELTLHIEEAKQFDNSIQFYGCIYDTKLKEARLDIDGRCDFTPTPNGVRISISIYDGQYDPDQPTAEIYDKKDGQLILFLDNEGKLTGTMTCASWGEDSPKAFRIGLKPVPQQQ